MTPEWTLIAINAIFLGFAYFWVYPSLETITFPAILWRDTVITCAALLVAGLLYYGTGTRFSLLVFDTNWAVFSVLTLALMEAPAFAWFARKHDLDF